jgi:hypothetical protein
MNSRAAQAEVHPRLSEADLCIIAMDSRSRGSDDRIAGTDEEISSTVRDYLEALGVDDSTWSWQLGSNGHWYLEAVAAHSDRLAALDWATTDSPYRLTPLGVERCQARVRALLAGPLCADVQKLLALRGAGAVRR